jgi:hypothetical protein
MSKTPSVKRSGRAPARKYLWAEQISATGAGDIMIPSHEVLSTADFIQQ